MAALDSDLQELMDAIRRLPGADDGGRLAEMLGVDDPWAPGAPGSTPPQGGVIEYDSMEPGDITVPDNPEGSDAEALIGTLEAFSHDAQYPDNPLGVDVNEYAETGPHFGVYADPVLDGAYSPAPDTPRRQWGSGSMEDIVSGVVGESKADLDLPAPSQEQEALPPPPQESGDTQSWQSAGPPSGADLNASRDEGLLPESVDDMVRGWEVEREIDAEGALMDAEDEAARVQQAANAARVKSAQTAAGPGRREQLFRHYVELATGKSFEEAMTRQQASGWDMARMGAADFLGGLHGGNDNQRIQQYRQGQQKALADRMALLEQYTGAVDADAKEAQARAAAQQKQAMLDSPVGGSIAKRYGLDPRTTWRELEAMGKGQMLEPTLRGREKREFDAAEAEKERAHESLEAEKDRLHKLALARQKALAKLRKRGGGSGGGGGGIDKEYMIDMIIAHSFPDDPEGPEAQRKREFLAGAPIKFLVGQYEDYEKKTDLTKANQRAKSKDPKRSRDLHIKYEKESRDIAGLKRFTGRAAKSISKLTDTQLSRYLADPASVPATAGRDLQDFFQDMQGVVSKYLRLMSGQAVTDSEGRRILNQAGVAWQGDSGIKNVLNWMRAADPHLVRRFIQTMNEDSDAALERLATAYGRDVAESFRDVEPEDEEKPRITPEAARRELERRRRAREGGE